MRIGVPKEIKNNENRIAITPSGVDRLVKADHEVVVETNAGLGSGFTDEDYKTVGAKIVATAKEAWAEEMVIKVKEPLEEEFQFFREDLTLFTFLHLAAESELTKQLIEKKVASIAYETVQEADGSLPLLAPMSEIAGRIAPQIGAQFLQKRYGGQGILLSGIPGVERGNVTVIGGGVVGTNAAEIALGLGAKVRIIDLNPKRLKQLDELFGKQVETLISNPYNIAKAVKEADLVVGAVLIPGTKAPKLVTEDMVKEMKNKAVIVDVAIDQGGIFETSDRVTTHDNPTYEKHGVVHYAVANMPGAVPKTASLGLENVTLPYVLDVANKGIKQASADNAAIYKGINTLNGQVTYKPVADAHGLPFSEASEELEAIEKVLS
ncbi:alanine dehydrogenase [Oceanobacillus alkalisoli]|uniref:alanine dehydrogenase n=1 Tax=Oceanobacillus alkalisoli TaxID=2925113 RepID=UPI001EE3BD86|nr:alanine dehydrogenase [Oceanobacillus alkalisoli]MCG5103363.1 alanine dehydrogenase [Oceanobacillus alkalisoli]